MAYQNRGGGFRPRGNFSRDRSQGGFGRDRPPRKMHKATCSECGEECEVPFKPDPDRPVYCKDCWTARRGMDRDRKPRTTEVKEEVEEIKEDVEELKEEIEEIKEDVEEVKEEVEEIKEDEVEEVKEKADKSDE